MRPHRVEVEAFGAFPGTVTVDLDELGGGGLVLLCGDTGSGKTTLLDALGFALYGTVPGERAKAKDLRSHHAADGVAPRVTVEFSARGRRWRVSRSPSWSRPGRVTELPATGHLERLEDGQWISRSRRLDEIGLELGGLLGGMTAEQFFQVVLLPQGGFAAFLQAKQDEREALLRQLFRVSRFEQAQRWLLDRAAQAGADAAAADATVAALVERVAQVQGRDLPAGEAPEAWGARLATGAVAAAAQAAAAAAAAGRDRTAAEELVTALRDRQRRQREGLEAQVRLASLEARHGQIEALRQAAGAARRAAPVRIALAELEGRAATQAQAAAILDQVRQALPGGLRTADEGSLEAAAAAGREALGGLRLLREVEAAAAGDEAAAVAAEVEAGELAAGLQQLRGLLAAGLPDAVDRASHQLATARAASSAMPRASQELAEAAEVEALARRRAEASREFQVTEETVRAAQAAADALDGEESRLRRRRQEAAATELASYLDAGTPCPVCGALEHPEPAEERVDDVTRDDERRVRAALEQARRGLQESLRQQATVAERLRGLTEQQGGRDPLCPAGVDELRARLTELAATAAGEGAAEAAVEAARRALAGAASAQARGEAAHAAAVRRGQEARRRWAAAREELVAAVGQASVEVRLEEVGGEVTAADAAAKAGRVHGQAVLEHRAAHASIELLLREQGFACAEDVRAALRAPERLLADEAAVREYDEELAAAQARLAAPDLAVDAAEVIGVEEAEVAAHEEAKRHERAVTDAGLCRDRVRQLEALLPRLGAAVLALVPLAYRAAQLRALADIAAGRAGNKRQMSLATFVLAARLEEVAHAASARLARMSGGRYTLVHSDSSRDRRGRAGLALQVDDAWTGRRRDTATLSGGETFLAALALALGLADVVTAEAGGATIDALFVDEGFGSLDPDSLDAVMAVLDELRSGGRLVGVVSHVPELRTRIAAQVQVQKGPAGSSVRAVC